MKNLMKASLIFTFLFTLLASGCKKMHDFESNIFPSHGLIVLSGISVSTQDFLVFDSAKNYDNYVEFLKTSSHQDIQGYLNSIHFESIGSASYSSANLLLTTDEQRLDYLVGTDRVFQIQNVIIKLANSDQFLLCMLQSNLNSSSFNNLVNGTYDSTKMDKFSTFSGNDLGSSLIEFVNLYPNGIEQTQTFLRLAHPIFGTTHINRNVDGGDFYDVYGNCVHTVHHYVDHSSYFFGIKVRSFPEYTGSTTSPGSNC